MSETLIARSSDLTRLRDDGFALEIHNGTSGSYLLVHDVPYVNSLKEIKIGTLVTPLELAGDVTAAPVSNHQMWFIGEHPCNPDGTEIIEIKHSSSKFDYGNGLVADQSFSVKLRGKVPYPDYHKKVTTYVEIIEGPAKHYIPDISAKTFRPFAAESTSVFKYADSATSRAGIGTMASKLANHKVAIIGLGGTGSYVLDLVAKTPVQEIHLFDGDRFHQHNAFRSPGAPALEELTNPYKVDYFAGIYSKMRNGIIPHPYAVTQANIQELSEFGFVFICIDKPESKEPIFGGLLSVSVPFIDVGLDVQQKHGVLFGQCRTTYCTPSVNRHIKDHISFGAGRANDIYASDIQVAELNALNATLAVVRWKKHFGFYVDQGQEINSVYIIGPNGMTRTVAAE
jgi:hypothetical protein